MSERSHKTSEHINPTEFDPFDHGTSTIEYESIGPERFRQLSDVMVLGWQISGIQSIEQVNEAEVRSNNFKVVANKSVLLLKESHVNSPREQDIVNGTVQYLRDKEVPVATILHSARWQTFFETDEGLFVCMDFIDGEHFDGSQEEVVKAAKALASLHRALEEIPFQSEIASRKGIVIKHDRTEFENLVKIIQSTDDLSENHQFVLSILDELDQVSREVITTDFPDLQFQIIHHDIHPHNLLFDRKSKELIAILDFDNMIFSQRARDVAYAMHLISRTYGQATERKSDIGVDIRDRAKLFFEAYNQTNLLTDEEIKSMSKLIQDQALARIIYQLSDHYIIRNSRWLFDSPKKIVTMREAVLFNGLIN